MKKSKIIIVAAALVIAAAGVFSYLKFFAPIKYERPIPQPLTVTAGKSSEASLGQWAANKTSVRIPAGTFANDTQVTLVSPTSVPRPAPGGGDIIGTPIELNAGDKPTRLQHMVQVALKFDPGQLPKDFDSAYLQAAFHDGRDWQFFHPDSVDMTAGSLVFSTDHFTLFGTAKIPIEEKIKQAAHSATLAEKAQEKLDKKMDKIMEAAIDDFLKKHLKLDPETYKSKILGSLLKKDEYRGMLEALGKGDFGEYNEKINALVGETLVEEVAPEDLVKGLREYLGDPEDEEGSGYMESVGEIAKVGGQAIGALAEGDMRGAARYIGEAIADKFVVTTAIKTAVEITQFEIDSWRDDKVESMYQIFKNGKESDTYLGYSVDKGKFEDLWLQSRAIGERLELEAVAKEEDIRREGNAPPLSDREIEMIKARVKTDLKETFETRAQQEDEIAKSDALYERMLKAYKNANLLSEGSFRYSRDKYDIDTRIESLLSTRRMILKDLRKNPKGRQPTDGDIVSLTQALLSGTMAEGRKLYEEKLEKEFGVKLSYGGLWLLARVVSWSSGVDDHVIYENPDVVPGGQGGELPTSLDGHDKHIDKEYQTKHTWSVPTVIEPNVPFTVDVSISGGPRSEPTATMLSSEAWFFSNSYLVEPRSQPLRLAPGMTPSEFGEWHVTPASGSHTETWKAAEDGAECKGCISISINNIRGSMTGFYYSYIFKK
jgi:hypothetical protein